MATNPNAHWEEDLAFSIEEWSRDDRRLLEVIARVSLLSVAHSAFWAACAARPSANIVMRQKAHVLKERRLG